MPTEHFSKINDVYYGSKHYCRKIFFCDFLTWFIFIFSTDYIYIYKANHKGSNCRLYLSLYIASNGRLSNENNKATPKETALRNFSDTTPTTH